MRAMNMVSCLALTTALIMSAAIAAPTLDSDEAQLRSLTVEWMTAIERKDRKSLESILADSFVLQMPGDTRLQYTPRAVWLENAINMDWSDFHYENIVVDVNGDSATVSSKLFFKVAPNPLTLDSGIVDTWRKKDGRWQVTARYLGESQLKTRTSFVLGGLAAFVTVGILYLIIKISRRTRRRAG